MIVCTVHLYELNHASYLMCISLCRTGASVTELRRILVVKTGFVILILVPICKLRQRR